MLSAIVMAWLLEDMGSVFDSAKAEEPKPPIVAEEEFIDPDAPRPRDKGGKLAVSGPKEKPQAKASEKPEPRVTSYTGAPRPRTKPKTIATTKEKPAPEIKPEPKKEVIAKKPEPKPVVAETPRVPEPEVVKPEPIGIQVPKPQAPKVVAKDKGIEPAAEPKQEESIEAELKKLESFDKTKAEEIKPAEPVKEVKPAEVKPATEKDISKPKAPSVTFEKGGAGEKIIVSLKDRSGAAVFERFGTVWVVIDTKEKLEMPKNLTGSSDIFGTSAKLAGQTFAMKLPLKKRAKLDVSFAENTWFIEALPEGSGTVDILLSPREDGEYWRFDAENTGKYVEVKDELTDDRLLVFPVVTPKAGAVSESVNREFLGLKSAQGLVLKPLGWFMKDMQFEPNAIKLKKANLPNIDAKKKIQARQLKPIYPFEPWPQLSGEAYRTEEAKAKGLGKLEYAKFLFSQKLYSEVVGNVQGYDALTPNFLRAASQFMSDKNTVAAPALNNLSVDLDYDRNELTMWQLAANYKLAQTNPGVAKLPDSLMLYLPDNLKKYPDDIKTKIIFSVAEYYLDIGKPKEALGYLDLLPKKMMAREQNYADYLLARMYMVDNKKARAAEMLTALRDNATNRQARAKASYALITDDIASKKLTQKDALKKLDNLLIVWRGDVFEYNLLNKLGDMYQQEGYYLQSLRMYKAAISRFPDFPGNTTTTERMKDIFVSAIGSDSKSQESAFESLTIFQEFKELLPVGEEGEELTIKLADKLAGLDLLSEAAETVQSQANRLEPGARKAELGTKAAILYFMNKQPRKAIDIIKSTEFDKSAGYIKDERRIITARSLLSLGEYGPALLAAAGMDPEEESRIKADVAWKKSDWPGLVDAHKSIENKSPEDIIKLAIANSILDNNTNLKLLRSKYSDMMKQSSYAEEFEYVSLNDNIDYRNLAASLKIDETAKLVAKYKSRIKKGGVDNLTSGASTPAATPAATKPAPAAAAPKPAPAH